MIYVWVLLAGVGLLLVLWFSLVVVWALLLRRMARAGIRSWDELDPEDAEPQS
jgi:hypothetical protein